MAEFLEVEKFELELHMEHLFPFFVCLFVCVLLFLHMGGDSGQVE